MGKERSTNLPWNLLKELDSSNNKTSSSTIGSKARAKSEKVKDEEKKQQEPPKVQERSTNLPWNLLKELDAPNNKISSSAVESKTQIKVQLEQNQKNWKMRRKSNRSRQKLKKEVLICLGTYSRNLTVAITRQALQLDLRLEQSQKK